MTKSPKNRRTRRPRSRLPQVNVGAQRTPTNPVQNAGRVVADTVSIADDAQANLIPRPLGASEETGTAYNSGLRTLAVNTTENLVIDTNDPGRADFIILR